MAKIIDITSKLSKDKPKIKIYDEEYEINNTVEVMLKLEEVLTNMEGLDSLEETLAIAIGKQNLKRINIKKWSVDNFQVLLAGIFAAIQGVEDVDSVLSRFQGRTKE